MVGKSAHVAVTAVDTRTPSLRLSVQIDTGRDDFDCIARIASQIGGQLQTEWMSTFRIGPGGRDQSAVHACWFCFVIFGDDDDFSVPRLSTSEYPATQLA